jgi:hypothetical protein
MNPADIAGKVIEVAGALRNRNNSETELDEEAEADGDQERERMLAGQVQLPKFRLAKFPVFQKFWQKPGHPATAWDLTEAVFEFAEKNYKSPSNRKPGEFGLVRKYVFESRKLYVGNELAATLGVENPEKEQMTRKNFNDRLICTYVF